MYTIKKNARVYKNIKTLKQNNNIIYTKKWRNFYGKT